MKIFGEFREMLDILTVTIKTTFSTPAMVHLYSTVLPLYAFYYMLRLLELIKRLSDFSINLADE